LPRGLLELGAEERKLDGPFEAFVAGHFQSAAAKSGGKDSVVNPFIF
jgi:hypothetical protein